MLTFQRELLCEVVEEVEPMLELHYQELTLNKDRVKLAPRWADYVALEQAGLLGVFTARDDGKLVGYAAFTVRPHMHYTDLIVAVNDVLFIAPAQRGSTGLRLIKFCETQAQAMGAAKIVWHAKYSNDLATILRKLGYGDEEVILGKFL